jgi:hypothetical protein
MTSVTSQAAAAAGRFDADPGVEHHFLPGVYAKEMRLPKGFMAFSHAHPFDHRSLYIGGPVLVRTDDTEKRYPAPAGCIDIAAGVVHSITAEGDVMWFCVHETDETDVNKIDDVLIGRA